jgi:hypothetical protein
LSERIIPWKDRPRAKNALILKLNGELHQIQSHCLLLKRVYGAKNLVFSPIIKNDDDTDLFHCFVDIILPSEDYTSTKTEEVQQ